VILVMLSIMVTFAIANSRTTITSTSTVDRKAAVEKVQGISGGEPAPLGDNQRRLFPAATDPSAAPQTEVPESSN
jgi:hypothetical protein